jgi:hypothetical protein
VSALVSVKNVIQSLFQNLFAPPAYAPGLRPRLTPLACAPLNTMLVCRANVSRAASVGCSSFTSVMRGERKEWKRRRSRTVVEKVEGGSVGFRRDIAWFG